MQTNNWIATTGLPALAIMALLIGAAACEGAHKQDAAVSRNEINFLQAVRRENDGDLDLARLAVRNSKNAEIRAYAQKVLADQEIAERGLDVLASAKNVQLPLGAGDEDAAEEAKLKALSGDAFDRDFIKQMIKNHKKTVSNFAKESKDAEDSDVKQYASKTLPLLKEHLANAETIREQLGGRPKG
jgi:putative membrane protein